MFRDVHDLPLRGSLRPSSIWALERRSLSSLRLSRTLCGAESSPSGFDLHDERIKRTHIVALPAPSDARLIASVCSDGLIEVHEPLDNRASLRIALRVPGATHAVWGAREDRDALYVSLAHSPAVWRFDLESCSEDVASRVHTLPAQRRTMHGMELVALTASSVAVAMNDGSVFVLDDRSKKPVAALRRPALQDISLAAAGPLLHVGAGGVVRAYDRRMLRGSGSARSMGDGMTEPLVKRRVLADECGFTSLHATTASRVAFQSRAGAIGFVDMLGASARTSLSAEGSLRTVRGADGLREYGTAMREQCTWWVHRCRGAVVPGALGAGVRFYAPLVNGNGFRCVAMTDGAMSDVVRVETRRPVACVRPVGEGGIVVGYASARVDLFEAGMGVPKDGEG